MSQCSTADDTVSMIDIMESRAGGRVSELGKCQYLAMPN